MPKAETPNNHAGSINSSIPDQIPPFEGAGHIFHCDWCDQIYMQPTHIIIGQCLGADAKV
jgi:hypothetical protein